MAGARRAGGTVIAITVVAAIVVAIGVVVWMAPANWLALQVAERTRGVVLLADARGTIWSGSAVMALGAPGGGTNLGDPMTDPAATPRFALPGRINWTLAIDRSLAPMLHLTHDEDLFPEPVVARLQDGAVTLGAGSAVFPASMLRLAGAPFNTLMPDGRCTLRWTGLRFDATGAPVGDGTLVVGALGLAVSAVRPLGDYRIAWSSGADGLSWQLTTERGPLDVGGAGSVRGRRAAARVTVRIAPDAPPAVAAQLNPLLDLIGRRGGSNEATVDTGGRS